MKICKLSALFTASTHTKVNHKPSKLPPGIDAKQHLTFLNYRGQIALSPMNLFQAGWISHAAEAPKQ